MKRFRNTEYYARIIAKEEGLPLWKVKLVLLFGWKNIVNMMARGEEVRLKGFGRIYKSSKSSRSVGEAQPISYTIVTRKNPLEELE
jgi:nucleoid DNA-binding protein